jgi:hypothetical protein
MQEIRIGEKILAGLTQEAGKSKGTKNGRVQKKVGGLAASG